MLWASIYGISDSAMTALLGGTWRYNADLPKEARSLYNDLERMEGIEPPEHISEEVCKGCGMEKPTDNPHAACPRCTRPRGEPYTATRTLSFCLFSFSSIVKYYVQHPEVGC